MKSNKLLAALLLAWAVPALAAEAVVSNTTNTRVDQNNYWRKAIEVQNNGPNPIFCVINGGSLTATQLRTQGRKIIAGDFWQLTMPNGGSLNCAAATAAQVGGADPSTATIVTEVP